MNSKRGEQNLYTGTKRRFREGKLIEEADYVNGKLHGLRRIWSACGVLLAEGEYRDGKPNGKCHVWSEDGRLSIASEYVNGKLNGHYESCWPDGKIKESGTYVGGRRIKYQWFDDKGNLVQSIDRSPDHVG